MFANNAQKYTLFTRSVRLKIEQPGVAGAGLSRDVHRCHGVVVE